MGLNNIASEIWEKNLNKAKDVINNFSVEGTLNWAKTNLGRSPEELADVARATMQRKNTVISNLNMNDISKAYDVADKSNAEYVMEFNRLKSVLETGNSDEAMSIANNISERFGDKSYLQYLQEAEGKYNKKRDFFESSDAETIRSVFINETKAKAVGNKIIGNFTDDGEWLANKAYTLNPRGIPAYFTTSDKKKNRIRAGAAAGVYAGSSMIVRGLQGGNPITNEYGERDIAGIPFI